MLTIATEVTCPIIVLKAKLVIVAIDTPFARVLVSNISAGIIQLNGPHVALKEKLYNQVMAMKPQAAAPLFAVPGGNFARRRVATINVTIFPRLPRINGQRRPV